MLTTGAGGRAVASASCRFSRAEVESERCLQRNWLEANATVTWQPAAAADWEATARAAESEWDWEPAESGSVWDWVGSSIGIGVVGCRVLLECFSVNLKHSGKTANEFLILLVIERLFSRQPFQLPRPVGMIRIVTIISINSVALPWFASIDQNRVINVERRKIRKVSHEQFPLIEGLHSAADAFSPDRLRYEGKTSGSCRSVNKRANRVRCFSGG